MRKSGNKTKDQLINELERMRLEVADLKKFRAEHEQKKEQLKYQFHFDRKLLDSIPIPVFYKDKQLTYKGCNKAFEHFLNIDQDQLRDKTVYDLAPEELADIYHAKDLELLQNPGIQIYESRVCDGNSKEHNIIFHKATYTDADGLIAGLIGVLEDITECKQAKNKLQRSESELAIMNKIAQVFLTVPDEEMYGMVMNIIRKFLDSPYGIFGYISEAGDLVIPSLTREVWQECKMQDKSIVFPSHTWGKSLWGRAIRNHRSYLANHNFKVLKGHIPITSFLTVPLIFQEKVIGLISVANRKDGYLEEHQQLLENIASFVSPILYARKQRDQQERERLLAEEARERAEADRKQAENSLKRSEYLYRAIFENAGNAYILVHEDTTMILVNSEFERLSGYSKEEIEGKKSWTEFFIEGDLSRMREYHLLRRSGKGAVPRKYECRLKDKWNNIKDIAICVDMIPSTKESIASLHDITEHRQAERILQESQQRLAGIIEFLPDATVVIDKHGKIIAWNRAMENMTRVKKEDMLGKGNYEYAFPFHRERKPVLVDFALHPDKKKTAQYANFHELESVISAESFIPSLGDIHVYATASVLKDSQGEVIAAIECVRDITERKRLAELLNRAEKMEALGTLAGGVAHDLNNVLGVLVGYTELMKEYLPEDSILSEYAENILQSGLRATAVIQDLLTMARRGVAISNVVNLNNLIVDYLKTPEFENLETNHPNVQLSTELNSNLFNIKGSPIHLTKTIMNLVSNAAESISVKGKIFIKTENRYLDQPVHGYYEMQEGDYAVLTVSDTGSGISAKDIDKIFEPFYTKKVMGRSGTGLGLAVVWGTVKDHNGYIDVQSREGKGTTFSLYFPITREEPAKVEKTAPYLAYMGKGESILVVDDVKEQRELAMIMLEKLGYRVNSVSGGEDAIEHLKNEKADLIVLDMIMSPGIDGFETYQRILDINPGQKAIIVSGFSETDRVRKLQEIGAGEFIRKPYTIGKIGLAIKNELARKRV